MSISLIHPSRGRAIKSLQTTTRWLERSSKDIEGELLVSVDSDEPQMSVYESYPKLIINPNKNVVQATNAAAKEAKGDILIYLSDDFDCPEGWDALVEKEFEGVTKPMLLKVDDCLQDFKVGVCTIPMMNRHLYELLGYFWYPDYYSMHVDVDLYETCKKIGAIKYAPHLKFPHNHYSNGKAPRDETYTRSEANWNQGLEVINRRRRQGFPI